MNEIDASRQLSELEILRRTEPTWKLAGTEPFIRSPQQDVTPPEWDKSGFLDTNGNLQGQGGGSPQATLKAVMGVQQPDASFAIKIVSFPGIASDP